MRITEAQYQRRLTDYADWHGVRWHHETDSRRTRAGWPDLVLCGPGGIAFLEVKTDTGRIRPEQDEWLTALTVAGQTAMVARPADEDHVRRLIEQLARPDGGAR